VKIIFIICFPPQYEVYSQHQKPKWYWKKADGDFVGIWADEWGDLLGNAVINGNSDIEFEVLQVDQRADRIYLAKIRTGLLHKNFPAVKVKHCNGLKIRTSLYSQMLVDYLKEQDNQNVILFLPATVINPLTEAIISSVNVAKVVHYNFLNTELLLPSLVFTYNPLRLLHRYLISLETIRHLKTIINLMTQIYNPQALERIKEINPAMTLFPFKFGVDLDFWEKDISKEEARAILSIPEKYFVMILSQRLVPEYQIDKFIEVISKLNTQKDFLCIITGHGLRDYETYLKKMTVEYGLSDRINFVGYVTDQKLKEYFIASDVFVTVPIMFEGSMGAVKAMALEKPVIHVTKGITYAFLKEHNAGEYLDPADYVQWGQTFSDVIDGKRINIIPRSSVISYFSWEKTAEEILQIVKNAQ
jgi:glycosyltransferase involved in cell wall biosynthesis